MCCVVSSVLVFEIEISRAVHGGLPVSDTMLIDAVGHDHSLTYSIVAPSCSALSLCFGAPSTAMIAFSSAPILRPPIASVSRMLVGSGSASGTATAASTTTATATLASALALTATGGGGGGGGAGASDFWQLTSSKATTRALTDDIVRTWVRLSFPRIRDFTVA